MLAEMEKEIYFSILYYTILFTQREQKDYLG